MLLTVIKKSNNFLVSSQFSPLVFNQSPDVLDHLGPRVPGPASRWHGRRISGIFSSSRIVKAPPESVIISFGGNILRFDIIPLDVFWHVTKDRPSPASACLVLQGILVKES